MYRIPPITINQVEQIEDKFCEWMKGQKSIEDSKMYDTFNGKFLGALTCSKCGTTNFTFSNFATLDLQIPREAERRGVAFSVLLQEYFRPENIDDYKCEKCNTKCFHTKRNYIWSLPEILIVVFKRFGYGYHSGAKKVQTRIRLENNEKIDFSGFFFPKSNLDGLETSKMITGYIQHLGTTEYGHYRT